MAAHADQRAKQYNLNANKIYNLDTTLDMECTTTEYDSSVEDSDTDTEEEIITESSKLDFTYKRLESLVHNDVSKPKVERRPTRKPDPNTCNRNALMARENRKKKKEYVEKLESNISQQLKTQKKLQKIIKKQAKLIRKLQKDKLYYKNVLSNKPEIFSLINTIKRSSQSSSDNITNSNDTPQTSPTYSGSDECFRSNSFSSQSHYNYMFEDDLNDYNTNTLHDSWDNLLDCNNPLFPVNIDNEKVIQNECHIPNINDEHNYVNIRDSNKNNNYDDEICLHINRGKISSEFCPKCNLRSTKFLSDTDLDVIN